MANIKISELNPLLTVEDADVLPIVDNGVTKKVTAAILQSYTQGNSVLLTGAQTVAGIKTFSSQIASTVATGTAPFSVASTTKVTNLNADLLDGLSSADFQAPLSGTGIVKSTAGTISYLTDNSTNWNTAYNDKINSAAVTGSGTNTLTLTQQDAGTITATWVNGTLIREVRNSTGATLTKGTIVYISGATGNKPTVSKAIATGDSTSAQTFGFIQTDIANNANGYVVAFGDLTGIDTSAFTEGDQLYLSSTTAGTFTVTKQYAPAHLVYVGIVTRSHPTLGQIEVNIQNGYEMDELHNVSAQNPSNGDILQFVTSTGLWTKVAGTTTNISEGTNLYFTNARSRSAFSESVTGLDYNSTTGVLSTTSGYGIPTTASQTTWDTAYNDSIVSAAVTGTTTKTLTLNQQDGGSVTASWTDDNTDAVSSVFGRTGAVVAASGDYTTTQVTEGTNLYFTDARVNANTNVAANTAARHNAVTLGTANGLSLSTQQLSLGLASGSATGALSSTDWTTFNNKQNALTNPITGTGTTNYLPKFTGASALGNSLIYDNGTNVGIGLTTASEKLEVQNAAAGAKIKVSNSGGGYASLECSSNASSVAQLSFTNQLSLIGGNVGIGTTSPASKFQVVTATNENVSLGSLSVIPTGRTLILQTDATGGSIETYSSLTSGYVPLLLNPNGASVLIGTTTNAGYKLDVNGTARVSGDLDIIKSGGANFGIKTTNDTTPYFQLNRNNGAQFFGAFVLNTGATYFENNNGTILNFASSGAATFSSSVTANGSVYIANANANNELTFVGTEFTNIFSETTSGIQFGITSLGTSAAIDFLTNNVTRLKIKSTGVINIASIPTSPVGLSTGDIWSNAGILTIV